jgi:endopeptidase La
VAVVSEIQEIYKSFFTNTSIIVNTSAILTDISKIETKYSTINTYIKDVKAVLDSSVHGHDKAKKQIERIIGQWINGKQDGYCFGFEGPPGVGKTSLAKKGLSACLKDENGVSRPFAMIQMGGDSNGSSLHGHNYTYVGSTWGSIVQILIDKKCMNPIIFIDEIDKISKTEQGKEIIGILTHLLDPAQNDCFQDKYFSGIDLDLSKALFVLSYNDVDAIDKILLDRVHRIKFKSLSLQEKITISQKHILPEVYEKMGLQNVIQIEDDVLKFIIDEYTIESGVRKLKEILFEVVGEINLDILKTPINDYTIPIHITADDIKNKYLKDKQEIRHKKIHDEDKIGIINGLWANAMGRGGVIPIQTNWRPSDKFLKLHLTGSMGDVMKESMNVALTLAWNLTPSSQKTAIIGEYSGERHGVHIHCPDGATEKDGPSAGTAITTTIYSLFNGLKIKHNMAITGEITLEGKVTEIGGLELKILGGIKAGVTEFIYPKENQHDYDSFMEKYQKTENISHIKFHSVDHINEVFAIVFC